LQYDRDDGRKIPISLDMPEEIERLALAVQQAGGVFELEVLEKGALYIECVAEGELISANICMNESEAVYTMLQEFLSATFYGFVMRLKNPI